MSVITYDPDDGPWTAEEVQTLLRVLPKNTNRIHVHFEYHDVKFNAEMPFLKAVFVKSTTNLTTHQGVTLLDTTLTESVIKAFFTLIATKPAYGIKTIRLLYDTCASVIDLDIREPKEIKILGDIQVPTALECKAAVPSLKKYTHVFQKDSFM